MGTSRTCLAPHLQNQHNLVRIACVFQSILETDGGFGHRALGTCSSGLSGLQIPCSSVWWYLMRDITILLLALAHTMQGNEPYNETGASFSSLLSQILGPSSPVTRTTNLLSSQLPSDPDYQTVLTKQPTLGFTAVRHPSWLSTIGCWGPVCPVRPQEFSWACLHSTG